MPGLVSTGVPFTVVRERKYLFICCGFSLKASIATEYVSLPCFVRRAGGEEAPVSSPAFLLLGLFLVMPIVGIFAIRIFF